MVIHKQNGGLAAARNTGYLETTGKYLMYVDSDDIVKKDVVENCVEAIEKEYYRNVKMEKGNVH